MNAITHPTVARRFVMPLVCGAALCCVQEVAVAASVDEALDAIETTRDVTATAAGAYTTSSVLGSSAPVILSTLKAAGGPVSAGAAAGLGVAGIQSKFLYSDCDNATACDAAAVSGYVGAGAGAASAVALAASYGVGASGLAGIGALVGGGMAVGATALIALPAVGAVAIGAGVYGIASWLSD